MRPEPRIKLVAVQVGRGGHAHGRLFRAVVADVRAQAYPHREVAFKFAFVLDVLGVE